MTDTYRVGQFSLRGFEMFKLTVITIQKIGDRYRVSTPGELSVGCDTLGEALLTADFTNPDHDVVIV